MQPKILIVDDDADIRLGLRVRLAASKYDTVMASDGISAISAYQREAPDLILLDLGLPGGDGFTVMERLKALGATAPILVLSARDPVVSRERALASGAKVFLQKPVDNETLLELIRTHCPTERKQASADDAPPAKLLIVDDDPDIRCGLNIRLKASGFETALATDAISAISQFHKTAPDVILLDLGLPGGDGFVVMERLRSMGSTTPIVVLSARDPALNAQRALNAGASAFLQKPASSQELVSALSQAIGRQTAPAPALRLAA